MRRASRVLAVNSNERGMSPCHLCPASLLPVMWQPGRYPDIEVPLLLLQPKTLCDDNDPIDVLVLMQVLDAPPPPLLQPNTYPASQFGAQVADMAGAKHA